MKTKKIIGLLLLLIAASTLVPQYAEAQRRRHKRVIVVKRGPGHRVVFRKAHVRYAALPRWGVVVNTRPVNAIVIGGRRGTYYYDGGVFYRPHNNAFMVVRPARGIRISLLPPAHRVIVLGPRRYYYYYGTYYVKSANDYVVIDAPKGAVVDALPDGYEIKNIDGNEYYYLDGVYYAEVDAKEFDDGVGYEVVDFN